MSVPRHVPVLLDAVLAELNPQPGGIFVDGTLGGGGHARAIAERVGPTGSVIGLDLDPAAIAVAGRNLADLSIKLIHSNYRDLPEVLAELKIDAVDGILVDLGLSSDQLADPERGFSFQTDGPLDLRFNPLAGEPAAAIGQPPQRRTLGRFNFSLWRRSFQPPHRQSHRRSRGITTLSKLPSN